MFFSIDMLVLSTTYLAPINRPSTIDDALVASGARANTWTTSRFPVAPVWRGTILSTGALHGDVDVPPVLYVNFLRSPTA